MPVSTSSLLCAASLAAALLSATQLATTVTADRAIIQHDFAPTAQAAVQLRKQQHAEHHRSRADRHHRQRQKHQHGKHGHGKDHSEFDVVERRERRENMYGSLFATYLAPIEIDGQLFDCIVDTGSSDTAVAASAATNCSVYYDGERCNGVELSVAYGDGNWSGNACTDEVRFGSMSLGQYTFAGMKQQVEMLQCDDYHTQNGIVGLAYPELLGPPSNYTDTFINQIVAHNNLPAVFGMQCCGWDDRNAEWWHDATQSLHFSSRVNDNAYEYAHGSLDIGGVRREHFTGSIVYTPIVHEVFYAVDMIDIRVGNKSIMPVYRSVSSGDDSKRPHRASTVNAKDDASLPAAPETIVDSGTSNIALYVDQYDALLAELKKYAPDSLNQSFWSGDWCAPHGLQLDDAFPDIYMTFAGTEESPIPFTLMLAPCRYLARAPASECDNGVAGHAWSIERLDDYEEGNILGQTLMESYYVVHDLQRSLVGFAVIDGCDSRTPCASQISYEVDEAEQKHARRSHTVSSSKDTGDGDHHHHLHKPHQSYELIDAHVDSVVYSERKHHHTHDREEGPSRNHHSQVHHNPAENNATLITSGVVILVAGLAAGAYQWYRQRRQQSQYSLINDYHEAEIAL